MGFDFASAKAAARQAVHSTLAVPVLFKDSPTSIPDDRLTARWHTKLVKQGDIDGVGAQVIEGVDRVIFDRGELSFFEVTPKRGDIVIFPQYQDLTVVLDTRLPADGPIEEIWLVTRE